MFVGQIDACAISTHAPRTGSDTIAIARYDGNGISTHAPRTGSDVPRAVHRDAHAGHFNPRSPHGERRISFIYFTFALYYFNPRSPHGERQNRRHHERRQRPFQPTLPARGATLFGSLRSPHSSGFQPTLPARGATLLGGEPVRTHHYFNPRSPHGERLTCDLNVGLAGNFNPRSPHGERRPSARSGGHGSRFQPTLPARGATRNQRE